MDKDKLEKLVQEISDQPYHKFIGFRVEEIGGEKCILRFSPSKNTLNYYGSIHGGIYYTVLDAAAFFLCLSKLNYDEQLPVTSNISVSVVKAVSEGDLRVEAKILKLGKRNCYLESRAFDKDGDLVAVCVITKAIVTLKK